MHACLCVDVHSVIIQGTQVRVLETQDLLKALMLDHERDLKKKDPEEYYID